MMWRGHGHGHPRHCGILDMGVVDMASRHQCEGPPPPVVGVSALLSWRGHGITHLGNAPPSSHRRPHPRVMVVLASLSSSSHHGHPPVVVVLTS